MGNKDLDGKTIQEKKKTLIKFKGFLYKKVYSLFTMDIYERLPETDDNYGYLIFNNGKYWDENESKVTAEILMIQHFIETEPHIEWADICIELVERYKK